MGRTSLTDISQRQKGIEGIKVGRSGANDIEWGT